MNTGFVGGLETRINTGFAGPSLETRMNTGFVRGARKPSKHEGSQTRINTRFLFRDRETLMFTGFVASKNPVNMRVCENWGRGDHTTLAYGPSRDNGCYDIRCYVTYVMISDVIFKI